MMATAQVAASRGSLRKPAWPRETAETPRADPPWLFFTAPARHDIEDSLLAGSEIVSLEAQRDAIDQHDHHAFGQREQQANRDGVGDSPETSASPRCPAARA